MAFGYGVRQRVSQQLTLQSVYSTFYRLIPTLCDSRWTRNRFRSSATRSSSESTNCLSSGGPVTPQPDA
jgi:hypothetical protein